MIGKKMMDSKLMFRCPLELKAAIQEAAAKNDLKWSVLLRGTVQLVFLPKHQPNRTEQWILKIKEELKIDE